MKKGKARLAVTMILKVVIFCSALIGTALTAIANEKMFMNGSAAFMYFTIQSNILVALISLVGAIFWMKNSMPGNGWYVFKFVGTVAITLTGVVFCFVLAPTLGDLAWNVQNVLTHVVTPILSVIDFFVVGTDSEIKKGSVVTVTIPPILYAIYAGIGYVRGWEFAPGYNYPYFFLNWGSPAGAFGFTGELPFMGTAWWILAILVFLIVIGTVYLLILDVLKGRRRCLFGKAVGK